MSETTTTEAPEQGVKNLLQNRWKWGLKEFLARTGLEDDGHGRAKFKTFDRAAEALKEFDQQLLRVLCTRS